MKTHKWMAAGAREAQIPKSPRLDDLCYDIEKSQVGNGSNSSPQSQDESYVADMIVVHVRLARMQ